MSQKILTILTAYVSIPIMTNTTKSMNATADELSAIADSACCRARLAFHKNPAAKETLALMDVAREAEQRAHKARCKVFAAKRAAR